MMDFPPRSAIEMTPKGSMNTEMFKVMAELLHRIQGTGKSITDLRWCQVSSQSKHCGSGRGKQHKTVFVLLNNPRTATYGSIMFCTFCDALRCRSPGISQIVPRQTYHKGSVWIFIITGVDKMHDQSKYKKCLQNNRNLSV